MYYIIIICPQRCCWLSLRLLAMILSRRMWYSGSFLLGRIKSLSPFTGYMDLKQLQTCLPCSSSSQRISRQLMDLSLPSREEEGESQKECRRGEALWEQVGFILEQKVILGPGYLVDRCWMTSASSLPLDELRRLILLRVSSVRPSSLLEGLLFSFFQCECPLQASIVRYCLRTGGCLGREGSKLRARLMKDSSQGENPSACTFILFIIKQLLHPSLSLAIRVEWCIWEDHNFMRLVSLQSLGSSCTRESWLLRSSIFSQSRCLLPTYICRGRLMRLVFSFIISHQCAIQPTERDTANNTVNMSLGMPMALQTMPVQKSTFGYSFRLMKYSSARAYFSKLIARSSRGLVSLSWMVQRTEQHIFCMMVARGSKFLYTLCPKPIRRKLEFLSLDRSMISLMEAPSLRISSSMFSTASLAPPWQGPQSDPIPAAIQAKGLAWELPAILTVDVEAFCSCSAWQIQMTSSALRMSSSMSKDSLMGFENIMQRKFFMQLKCFFGQTIGRPMAVRQAYAARVGILAISLMAIYWRSLGLNRSQSECRKADNAPTTPTMMAMGCASLLNPLQNSIIFSFIIISPMTTSSNFISSLDDGSVPYSKRQQVSIQEECSARSWMRYPLQSSSPFSPLMQQILEMQLAVHMKPGSQVSKLACASRVRTSMRSQPRVPLRIGSSYSLSPTFRIAFCYSALGQSGLTSVRSNLSFINKISINYNHPCHRHQTPKMGKREDSEEKTLSSTDWPWRWKGVIPVWVCLILGDQ